MNNLQQQSGLTLVELLIASTLGLLLTLGVAQLFVSSSDSFRMAEAIGRMQESGRLAHDILGRTIRNADYWGCTNSANVMSAIDEADNDFDSVLHDFSEPEAVQFDIADGTGDAVKDTIIIHLKGARSPGISVDNSVAHPVGKVAVTSGVSGAFGEEGLAFLTNCDKGVVFQLADEDQENKVLDVSGGAAPGNTEDANTSCTEGDVLNNCFPDTYSEGDIFIPFSESYYIYENGGRSALVYEGIGGGGEFGRQELVSDVVNMQVNVGTGKQGDNIITQWEKLRQATIDDLNDPPGKNLVKAVRVSLLVRSPEDRVARSKQTACYPAWADCSNGDNWEPESDDDRHYYRVYTSTYSIRNRLLDED